MNGFLYFAPGAHAFSAELPERLGLSSLLGRQVSGRGVGTGPDGNPGVILGREGVDVRFREEGQVWLAAEKYWVGCEENALPGPEDLLREENIAGHAVRMGDKNHWLVPALRMAATGTVLPHGQYFAYEEGHFQSKLRPEFMEFGAKVEKLWDDFAERIAMIETEAGAVATFTMQLDDDCALVIEALAFNYRIGLVEATLLGLLDPQSVPEAIKAMLDVPSIDAILKKNPLAESPSSGSGIEGA